MKCFWIFFHKWNAWKPSITVPSSNKLGHKGFMCIQTRTCKICNKEVWRRA